MKRLLFITITLLCITQAFALTSTAEESTSGVDRYAIYIGSNKGGKGREQLLYAGSDTQNFQKAMSEIGGVADANSYVLIDPTKEKIDIKFEGKWVSELKGRNLNAGKEGKVIILE